MKKKILITTIAVIFCLAGTSIAAEIINNYYGDTNVNFDNQGDVAGVTGPEDTMVGDVTPTGGICNGSEPATTMCNLSAYELGVETDVTIDDDATITGDVDINGETSVEGFTDGAGAYATSTSASAAALNQAELLAYNMIEMTANVGTALALSLPASSTWTTLIPDAGDHREWLIHNATTSAGMIITITAGTGIDLIGVTTNDDPIDGTEYSQLECYRQIDTDITCITSELLNVD